MDLFIDSSLRGIHLILADGPQVIEEIIDQEVRGESIGPFLDQISETHKIDLSKSLKRIMVVNGPGSFTGIRVGLAFALGWIMGNKVELFSVSSLRLLHHLKPDNKKVAVNALPGHWFVGEGLADKSNSFLDNEKRMSTEEIESELGEDSITLRLANSEFSNVDVADIEASEILSLFSILKPIEPTELEANYLQASAAEKALKK